MFDLTCIGERQPELQCSLPGGASHVARRRTGYRATLVNGMVAVRDNEHTGQRARQVQRQRA